MCYSVNGSVCFVCVVCVTVFVNCLVKQFAMCLGVVAILLLNQLHPHMHHCFTTGFVDRPHRRHGTAGQMEGKFGWWTTNGNIGLPPTSKGQRSG